MDATTVAVNLAKDVFEVAVANRAGRIVEHKRLTRRQFEHFIDTLTAGTEVIMEGCGTAHYWGRRCQARDIRVRLLPVQYVRPYVRRNKTDRTDTEALLEANRCGGIQPVPVKTVEQQTLQALHRVRTQWQAARTARINVVRGLLREQGLPVPVGARTVLARVAAILEDADVALPNLLRHTAALVVEEIRALEIGRAHNAMTSTSTPRMAGSTQPRKARLPKACAMMTGSTEPLR
jgi:transposase